MTKNKRLEGWFSIQVDNWDNACSTIQYRKTNGDISYNNFKHLSSTYRIVNDIYLMMINDVY